MKSINMYRSVALIAIIMSMASCEAIKGIFKAGMWSGILIVVVIIAIVIWIISRFNKK